MRLSRKFLSIALAWGLSIYFVFYLSLLPLMRLYVARRRTDRNID